VRLHQNPVEACNQLPSDRLSNYAAEAIRAVTDFKKASGEWPSEDEVDRTIDQELRCALDTFRGAVLGPKRKC